MLGRSASPDEVLIIHLCLTGNESTIYSKHPFERGKHIEMNFATKLEPFSLLPRFCINSSFLSSSMPSCTLQRFCFLAPHILSLALSPALQFCPYSWHKVHFLCCLSSIFKLYSALQTSEAQLYSRCLVQQRMPAISWLCHIQMHSPIFRPILAPYSNKSHMLKMSCISHHSVVEPRDPGPVEWQCCPG